MSRNKLPIREVARITGIPRNTLLAWERRYGVVTPERAANGYRMYDESEVELLRQVQNLVQQGHRISNAVRLAQEAQPEKQTAREGLTEVEGISHEVLGHLLRFDRAKANQTFFRLGWLPLATVIDDVLAPILRQVGDMWERGEATVAQEHFTSAFVRDQLLGMLYKLGPGTEQSSKVVCAGYPGEQHEMGLLMIALHLRLLGFATVYLGADVPPGDLASVANVVDPVFVCQSVFQPISRQELREHVAVFRGVLEDPIPFVAGGRGVTPDHADTELDIHVLSDFEELATWIRSAQIPLVKAPA